MKAKILFASLVVFSTFASLASANAKENNWIIRGRAVNVSTDSSSTVSQIGGHIKASTDQIPELDFTKFFNDNIAAELILGTSKHNISVINSSLGSSSGLGSVKLLPPTLTMQYHFNPKGKIRPYAGAGLNYTIFYGAKTGGVANSIRYQDHLGYAFQAGFDYMIDDKFSVNFDVKKILLKTHAVVNNSISAKVNLDPWLVGFGVGYHF